MIKIFEETGALLSGHFLLSSGRHSDRYLQSALVLQYPPLAEKLARALAEKVRCCNVQAVSAPALGGILVGYELARALGVRAIFTERDRVTDRMELRRGFTVKAGERVLVAEDVLTTGRSLRETLEVLQEKGAVTPAAAALVDRSGGALKLPIPHETLAVFPVESWEPSACPLCREKKLPLVKPGSRGVFSSEAPK